VFVVDRIIKLRDVVQRPKYNDQQRTIELIRDTIAVRRRATEMRHLDARRSARLAAIARRCYSKRFSIDVVVHDEIDPKDRLSLLYEHSFFKIEQSFEIVSIESLQTNHQCVY
jgi:hypothetical protein